MHVSSVSHNHLISVGRKEEGEFIGRVGRIWFACLLMENMARDYVPFFADYRGRGVQYLA